MLSIIICTYNREKYIYNVLKSVADNDFSYENYEILLINNNCTDNTTAQCERFKADFPSVDFQVYIEKNQGLSHARNRGIKESKGETLIFLDDDAFVGKDYLHKVSTNLVQYPEAMAFGGKITPIFESGERPKWLSKWNYSWVSAIDKGNEVVLFVPTKNDYPIGANMGIRRKIVEQCGDFNVELGRSKKNLMGGEEKDIFNRIANAGHKIYYFPDIEAKHVIPPQRVTFDFIKKLGEGVGRSEKMRTQAISKSKYVKRVFSESVKWIGTLVLFFAYLVVGRIEVGRSLIVFRFKVTKGLIEK